MQLKNIRRAGAAVLLMLALLSGTCMPAAAAEEMPPEPEFDGYLVRLNPDGPALLSEEASAGDNGMEKVAEGLYQTRDKALAEELLHVGAAERVSPNYIIRLQEEPTAPAEPLEECWNYRDMQGALALEKGLDGSGIRIAIIDTGVERENPNLTGTTILQGYDCIKNSNDAGDIIGHGTMVAQMIAGIGFSGATKGMAPEAELVPLKVFVPDNQNRPYTTVTALIRAVDKALEENCHIITMSLGGGRGFLADLEPYILKAHEAGVVILAAAGNLSVFPDDTVSYPAGFDHVIGVGGYEHGTVRVATHSKAVDVAAPCDDIRVYGLGNKGLKKTAGTSFACPAVAGVAALILQLQPDLTPEEVEAALKERATGNTEEEPRTKALGWGKVGCDRLFTGSWLNWSGTGTERRIKGWGAADGLSKLMLARYDGARFLDCSSFQGEHGLVPVSTLLGRYDAALFYMNQGCAPVRMSERGAAAPAA